VAAPDLFSGEPLAKSLDAPGGAIALWWKRLSRFPFGRTLFSILIGRMAPYTGTMGARIQELGPGYSRWTLRDRRGVRNHLDSIHAVALVNLAEVASGTAMLTALPPGTRGIVTGLSMTYLKKARGTLTAECRCAVPEVNEQTNVDVHADIRDEKGDVVARGTVNWLLRRS
jgi:acyl-coenzyme A thioesterase PaaI-like protein